MSEYNGGTVRLSKRRKETPLLLEDEDGKLEHYVLREMMGNERDAYLDAQKGRVRQQGEFGQVTNFKDIQTDLICRHLHRAELELDEHGEVIRIVSVGSLVPSSEVKNYPASTQQELFQMCQQMSALNVKAKEEAKNS